MELNTRNSNTFNL